MNLFRWSMATFYDLLMRPTERACLGGWRQELLTPLSGRVVEIGAGTGANLAHYPAAVKELILSEPDSFMRDRLETKLRRLDRDGMIISTSAERIPFPGKTFDAAIATLVLCSVGNPEESLAELYRVLKPGGRLALIEHVVSPRPGRTCAWQRRLEPLWKRCAGHCHLTRDTLALVRDAGFSCDKIVRDTLHAVPFFVAPAIRGIAEKT